MRMLDEIKLRTALPSGGALSSRPTPLETVAYADVRTVKRSEYYAAQAAGQRVDLTIIVNDEEYSGQSEVEYAGNIYLVVRAYRPNAGTSN